MKIFLAKASNWKLILPAFLVSAYCIYLFQTYQADMGAMIGEETLIIDMRSGYTEPEISEFFTQLKEEGRSLHHKSNARKCLYGFAIISCDCLDGKMDV